MKNASLVFLIMARMLFLSDVAAATDVLQAKKPQSHYLYEINHIAFNSSSQSEFVYIQDGLTTQVKTDKEYAGFYESTPKEKEANILSIIPYWFYVLKIVILIVVLFWDDSDKAKSMRKSAKTK